MTSGSHLCRDCQYELTLRRRLDVLSHAPAWAPHLPCLAAPECPRVPFEGVLLRSATPREHPGKTTSLVFLWDAPSSASWDPPPLWPAALTQARQPNWWQSIATASS